MTQFTDYVGGEAMKRIMWVTNIDFSRTKGDWAQTVYNLKALSSAGYKVDVIHPLASRENTNLHLVAIPGVKYWPVNTSKTSLHKAAAFYYMVNMIDKVIVRGPELAEQLRDFVSRDKMVSYIYNAHFEYEMETLESAWDASGKVIVQGDGQLKHVKELGLDIDRAVSIPCAIDVLSFEMAQQSRCVGYIGSLFKMQCVDLNIEVVSLVRNKIGNVKFVICGSETTRPATPWESKLVNAINSTPWISWFPIVTHQAIPVVFTMFDVMVSLFDMNRDNPRPFSDGLLKTKILESMAAGVPVVANRTSGNIKLLGEDCRYFADSVEEAAEKVPILLNDYMLRIDESIRLKNRVKQYDIKSIGAMYAKMLGGNHTG